MWSKCFRKYYHQLCKLKQEMISFRTLYFFFFVKSVTVSIYERFLRRACFSAINQIVAIACSTRRVHYHTNKTEKTIAFTRTNGFNAIDNDGEVFCDVIPLGGGGQTSVGPRFFRRFVTILIKSWMIFIRESNYFLTRVKRQRQPLIACDGSLKV